jgi:excisionase family DNA binding protein
MNTKPLDVLTVSEFCQSVGISRSTWHKLKRKGKTPAIVSVGGIQRIRREAIETWLSENEERANADAAHNAVEGAETLHV